MQKESISLGQAICLVALFIMGSSLTLGTAGQAKTDLWISIILAMLMTLPMLLIYTQLLQSFPGRDLFDILEIVLGKFFGKVVTVFYVWFSLHLAALVNRNFAEFVNVVAFPETPIFVILLLMGLLAVWIVKSGIEVMARSGKLMLILVMFVIAIVIGLSIPQLEFGNLKPFLGNGLQPVVRGAFSAFAFPFAETVVLTGAIFSIDKKKMTRRAFLVGFLYAGGVILTLSIRNIIMLGADYLSHTYFPSYVAVSRIKVGDFIQRIEGTVDIVFQTTAFFKVSVCLYVCTKGFNKLFGYKNYREFALQIGLIMVFLSYIIYDSIMEMTTFMFGAYMYYAFPFEVFFPIIVFVVYLIRKRSGCFKAYQDNSEVKE